MARHAQLGDGGHIAFDVFGAEGPFVFLGPQLYLTPPANVPGFADIIKAYVEGLSDRYRVILADWPRGLGGQSSPPRSEAMHKDRLVHDLHAVADAAGAETFAWWGYSFGAAVGLQLARGNPRVSAFACAGFPPLWQPLSDMLGMTARLAHNPPRSPDHPDTDPESLASGVVFYRSVAGQDDWAALEDIRCPRLVLHDVDDSLEWEGLRVDLAMRTRAEEATLKAAGWDVAWVDTGLRHGAFMNPKACLAGFAPFLDRALLNR